MAHKYEFQSRWLNEEYCLGFKISTWCMKDDNYKVKCLICDNKSFSHSAKGLRDLKQHYESTIHRKNAEIKLDKNQLKFSSPDPSIESTENLKQCE